MAEEKEHRIRRMPYERARLGPRVREDQFRGTFMLHSHVLRKLTVVVLATGVGIATAGGLSHPREAIASVDLVQFRGTVIEETNSARKVEGCKALTTSERLTKSAEAHARDMSENDYFSHTSQDGRTWDERIEDAGYPDPGGENIAYGYESAAAVHRAWMDSPGHRRNILDCEFRRIGIGHESSGDYWVQDFGY